MTKEELHSQIRYAIRLTERTARLYRKVQATGVVLTIVGGSAAVAAIGNAVPESVSVMGAALFAVAGAFLIAVRPADKIAQNDTDARRYQALIAKMGTMTESEVERALEEARAADAPEIEPLRDVAYNDVVIECAQPEFVVELNWRQKLLAALA